MNETAGDVSLPETPLEASEAVAESPASPGRQLAAAREFQGWSVEQVASKLNLAPRQIEALEAGRLEQLPSMMVARGFIGTYARLLKIDAAPLLAMVAIESHSPLETIREQERLSAPFSAIRLPTMQTRATALRRRRAMWPVLALVVTTAIWWSQQEGWRAALPEALLAGADRPPSGQAAATGLGPVAEAESDRANSNPTPRTADADSTAPAVAEASEAQEVPVQVMVAAAAPPMAAASASAAAGNNSLSLAFRQDSWIEIKREDGAVLVSRVAKAGTTETFEMVDPVLLVVGNVAGVDATLRNHPLDLKSGTSSNVARVKLK